MKNRYDSGTETPEQIIEHISRLMAEAEAMLAGPVAQQAGERISDLRERLSDARAKMGEMYATARRNVVAGAKYTDRTIREYPYYAIGIALGIGLLAGTLMRRDD
ncbi:DUF883 family protein [Opitutus sp. ER46]|uniref:DUF883 family protein n=1 Tax=Opitutus sp. ER46 TaxID=2161864 RepID=UPI001304E208|nr:DUF883 family protein [Opitutus sp. ER46]